MAARIDQQANPPFETRRLKTTIYRTTVAACMFSAAGCVETLPQTGFMAALNSAAISNSAAPSTNPLRAPYPGQSSGPGPAFKPPVAPSYDVLYGDLKCTELKSAKADMVQREKWLLQDRAQAMGTATPVDGGAMGGGSLAAAAGLGVMTGGLGLLVAPMLESALSQATSQMASQSFDVKMAEIKAHQRSIGKTAKARRCKL